jgi:hypothetical protein
MGSRLALRQMCDCKTWPYASPPVAKLFLVIHLLMTVAFVVAGRASMRAQRR